MLIRDLTGTPILVSDQAATYRGVVVQNISGRTTHIQVFDVASVSEVRPGVTRPVIQVSVQSTRWTQPWDYRQAGQLFKRGIVIAEILTGFREPTVGWVDHTKPVGAPAVGQLEGPTGVHVHVYFEIGDTR